ncbi:hypothetical protein BDW74DRAFT_60813 [Aspergillus multicolor]|uniref:uncharacterized protein n=1 Tax=Aspergillus multicolor TaxID=41759 RepID=UPI003CCCEAEF
MFFTSPIKTAAGITIPFDLKEVSVEEAARTTAIIAQSLRGINCMSYKVSTGYAVNGSKKLGLGPDTWWLLISLDTPKDANSTMQEDMLHDLMGRLGCSAPTILPRVDRAETRPQAQEAEKLGRVARIRAKIRKMQETSLLDGLKASLDNLNLHHEKIIRVYDDIPFLLTHGVYDADFEMYRQLCRHLQAGGETRLCPFGIKVRDQQTWDTIDARLGVVRQSKRSRPAAPKCAQVTDHFAPPVRGLSSMQLSCR